MGFFSKIKDAFFQKDDKETYLTGLEKGQTGFGFKLKAFFSGGTAFDAAWFDHLMMILIQSDVSIKTSQKLIKQFKKRLDPSMSNEEALDEFVAVCADFYGENVSIPTPDDALFCILFVGVNGSGKTTSAAKLGFHYQHAGKKVLLVAADTFRAAAIAQLETWGGRLGIEVFSGQPNADPASVLVDGARYAKANGFDVIICDTAGRLQNKVNLMNELAKMKKVLVREIGQVDQTYLVLDATTGQNGLSQAKQFQEATAIDSIILTKMDGTAKGGILLAIRDELSLKVSYLGLGEKVDQLRLFDINAYLFSLVYGDSSD